MKTIRLAVFMIGSLIALNAAAQTKPRPEQADRREKLMNSTPEERANRRTGKGSSRHQSQLCPANAARD
jgi:hypothetical protein